MSNKPTGSKQSINDMANDNDLLENLGPDHVPAEKEKAYDEKVFPLMQRIQQICLDNKISMVATFCLSETQEDCDTAPLMCTSALISPEEGLIAPMPMKLALEVILGRDVFGVIRDYVSNPKGSIR